MKQPLKILRVSMLNGWADCPRRTAWRLLRPELQAMGFVGRQLPGGVGASIGSGVHAGAAFMLEEKARRGVLPPLSVATECAVDTAEKQMEDGVIFDRVTGSTRDAQTQIQRMTRAYYQGPAQVIRPITVETRLEAVAPFGGFIISGQSDVVGFEPGAIRDTKTGQKRGNYRPQIGGYSLLNRAHGLHIETAFEDFIQRVSLRKDQPDAVSFPHDIAGAETAALSTLAHIARCVDLFNNGDQGNAILPGDPWAFPANPASILCSEKYCECHSCPKESSFCNEWLPKESTDE